MLKEVDRPAGLARLLEDKQSCFSPPERLLSQLASTSICEAKPATLEGSDERLIAPCGIKFWIE
jgi:hypothetical protein